LKFVNNRKKCQTLFGVAKLLENIFWKKIFEMEIIFKMKIFFHSKVGSIFKTLFFVCFFWLTFGLF